MTEFIQQGSKLVGTGNIGTSRQGDSVSVSGNTLAVGGSYDDGYVGATWIFTRGGFGEDFAQQQKLVGTGYIGSYTKQGNSVALSSSDGNTLAVGADDDNTYVGATWIFTRSSFGNPFTQQGLKLVGTGYTGNSNQGSSLALSSDGNTLAVGGEGDDSFVGATWIFTRTGFGNPFTQQGLKLVVTGNIGSSRQGSSLDLSSDGNTLAVGAPWDDSFVGATWIFTRTGFGNPFTQQQKVVVTDAIGIGFLSSVSLSGDTLAIGASADGSTGATWIFTRTSFGNPFTQQQKLIATGAVGDARQGISVSVSGNTLAIGGYSDDTDIGATWIFTRTSISEDFTQQGLKLVGTGNTGASRQGISVDLSSDNTLVVGGTHDNSEIGAAWAFTIPIPFPCFLEGTLITTRDGEKEVKDLTSDDYIVDKFSENNKIKSVFCSEIPKNFEELVYLSKDCFEPNKPNRPIICTKYHRFEINGVQTEAGDLINNQSIYQYSLNTRSKIYHILLEDNKHLWMQVAGVLAESLDPTMVYKDSLFLQ